MKNVSSIIKKLLMLRSAKGTGWHCHVENLLQCYLKFNRSCLSMCRLLEFHVHCKTVSHMKDGKKASGLAGA
jgi:hypothetical protein